MVEAFRRFAIGGRGNEVRVILQDADAPAARAFPIGSLAQRLPERVPDPRSRGSGRPAYPSAYLANDAGGYYFRTLGHRFDGEADLHAPGRSRQLRGASCRCGNGPVR